MSDILPCPFCGGKANVHKVGSVAWYAYCDPENNCGAQPYVGGYPTAESAIAGWNRRAPLPTIPHNGTINATEKANG